MANRARLAAASVDYSLISPEGSWSVRRMIGMILAFWIGCASMAVVAAMLSFRSFHEVWSATPGSVGDLTHRGNQALLYTAMRFQAGEISRAVLLFWGWAQLVLAALVAGLLLFATIVGRSKLVLGGLVLVFAVVMQFLLTPWLTEMGRAIDLGQMPGALPRLRLAYECYGLFQLALVILCAALMLTLLRQRARHTTARTDSFE